LKTGLYLHIPFCKKACHYCDFHFSTVQNRPPVLGAMVRELQQRAADVGPLTSIYFGGGSPSLLEPHEMQQLWDAIKENFTWTAHAEITLEANPDDLTAEQLQFWRALGFNRLSVGIQSFHEKDLVAMNRAHGSKQALAAIPAIRAAGFTNFSIDLMYGLPTSTLADWDANLQTALGLKVPHLSAYALTIEPRTALAHFVKKGSVKPQEDAVYEAAYQMLLEQTTAAGMVPYELSNFCMPGFEAVHNGNYWEGAHYIGIGPGAHSFDGHTRSWNVANNNQYAKAFLTAGERLATFETLTAQDRFNEYLMTGLRTLKGIDVYWLAKTFHEDWMDNFQQQIKQLKLEGQLAVHPNGRLYIPPAQRFMTDAITRDLFVV